MSIADSLNDASVVRGVVVTTACSWEFYVVWATGELCSLLILSRSRREVSSRVFASSGRVNQSPPSQEAKEFTFLSHMVLLVQLDENPPETQALNVLPKSMAVSSSNQTYLVDVGFGGTGIVRPMLLEVGHITHGSAPPEEHRLVREMHPNSSLNDIESSRVWVLQYRCGSHQPNWTTLYIFGETETYTSDWIAYSQWLCAHPVDLFLHNVIAVRHFNVEGQPVQDNGNEVPLGRLVMIGTRVQRRIGTQSQTIREFYTEFDRVRILKDYFGISVDENEVGNIKSPAALQ